MKEMEINIIESRVNSSSILSHPFLLKLHNGNYNKDQLRLWISQQFYFSNQFPRCLGLLWSRIPDYEIALPLMKFLSVEHWGSDEENAHWKQYRDVLDYFRLTIEGLKNTPPLPETKAYLDYRFNVCMNASIEEGLGCMGFAHEYINEKIFQYYYQGVKNIDGVPDSALRYFVSHIDDEPEDYRIFKKIMCEFVSEKRGFSLIEKGALETLKRRTTFFDQLEIRMLTMRHEQPSPISKLFS